MAPIACRAHMEPVCTIAPPRPAARGLHGPRSSLSGEEGAVEDVVEKTIEFDLGHLEEGLRREDAGIVEQHIEAAEAVERRLHESFAGGRQRDVAHIDGDARPRRVDIMGSRLGLRAIAAVDNDGTALGDEAGRKLLTMPEPPPVTIAILSWNRIVSLHLHIYLSIGRCATNSPGQPRPSRSIYQ